MHKESKNIFILTLLAFTGAVGISLLRPIIPIFTRRMGASGLEIGSLASGFMLARAVTSIIIGRYSDKLGKRKVFLPIGFLAYIISCVLLFFSKNYTEVLMVSILQGLFSGIIWPMAQVITIENSKFNFKTRALSFYFASGNAGMSMGNALLGLAIIFIMFIFKTDENFAFRIIFLISGVIYLIGFFLTFLINETKGQPEVARKKEAGISQKRDVRISGVLILGFLIGTISGLFRSIIVLYLNEKFLMATQNIAFVLMTVNVFALFSMLIFSYFSDRFGLRKNLIVICLITAFAAITVPFINNTFVLIVFLVILGTGARSFTPVSRSTMSEFDMQGLGKNIGLINTVANLGAVIGPLVGGFFYDTFTKPFLSINSGISVLSVVGVLILIALFALVRR